MSAIDDALAKMEVAARRIVARRAAEEPERKRREEEQLQAGYAAWAWWRGRRR